MRTEDKWTRLLIPAAAILLAVMLLSQLFFALHSRGSSSHIDRASEGEKMR